MDGSWEMKPDAGLFTSALTSFFQFKTVSLVIVKCDY